MNHEASKSAYDVVVVGVPKVTMIAPWDLDSFYRDALSGRVSGLGMHIPTVCDESLAPPGEHLVILQALVPSGAGDLSPTASARFASELLDLAERVLPGLRDQVTFAEGFSEEGQRRYPLHRVGPMYGWAASPQQVEPRRLPNRTPVEGLFLVGHWTRPSHGIWTVVLSGINVARLVLGNHDAECLWPFALYIDVRSNAAHCLSVYDFEDHDRIQDGQRPSDARTLGPLVCGLTSGLRCSILTVQSTRRRLVISTPSPHEILYFMQAVFPRRAAIAETRSKARNEGTSSRTTIEALGHSISDVKSVRVTEEQSR